MCAISEFILDVETGEPLTSLLWIFIILHVYHEWHGYSERSLNCSGMKVVRAQHVIEKNVMSEHGNRQSLKRLYRMAKSFKKKKSS